MTGLAIILASMWTTYWLMKIVVALEDIKHKL